MNHVPTRPIRQWLLAWSITTGDPPGRIAQGFDLDATLVEELLGVEPPRMLTIDTARALCIGLRLHPSDLWPYQHAAIGDVWWPTEPLDNDLNASGNVILAFG